MQTNKTPYERQIFVCTNNANGEKASCGDHKGEEIFRQMREIAKARKLHPQIRVAQAKCLGQCVKGVNIMVYPENVWHSDVRLEDVAQLADKYIISSGEHSLIDENIDLSQRLIFKRSLGLCANRSDV